VVPELQNDVFIECILSKQIDTIASVVCMFGQRPGIQILRYLDILPKQLAKKSLQNQRAILALQQTLQRPINTDQQNLLRPLLDLLFSCFKLHMYIFIFTQGAEFV
jgi:hypothetical protein